jgi:hypothetical protein
VGTALLFVYLLIHTPPDGKGCGFAVIGAAVGAVLGGGIGYAFAVQGLKTIRGEGWGAVVHASSKPHIVRCLTRLKTIHATGAVVIIPGIAHYEVRRELLRIWALGSLRRLDYTLEPSSGFEHLFLTTDAIVKAAEFRAGVRHSGMPTSSLDALDADVILAGQAALGGQPGDTVTIATTNLAHLNRFLGIDVQTWDQIR